MMKNKNMQEPTYHPVKTASVGRRRLAFVIRNFDILEWGTFTCLVDRARRQGFTTVVLHLSWFNAEKLPGIYEFDAYDAQIAYIVSRGMDIILNVDLQRRVYTVDGVETAMDAVIGTDEFQYAHGADTYVVPTDRHTAMVSFASETGVEAMVRFYGAAAAHFSEKFGREVIAYAYPTFTPFCETEYWRAGAYDYSVHAKRAFTAFLAETYAAVDDLNLDLGTSYAAFEDVPMPPDTDRGPLGVLFYQCRHKTLKQLIDRLAAVQKTAAPEIPFAVQFGCVWDEASVRRCTLGFADLSEPAALVVADDAPGSDHAFSMDWIASALVGTKKTFGCEIGGYDKIENGTATAEGYMEQGLTSYRHNASVAYAADWTAEEPLSNFGYIFSTVSQEYLADGAPCDCVEEASDTEQIHIPLLKLFETGSAAEYQDDYRAITEDGDRFCRICLHDDLTTKTYPNSIRGKDIRVDVITPGEAAKEEEKKSTKDTAMAVAAIGAAAAIVALGVAVKVFFSDRDGK